MGSDTLHSLVRLYTSSGPPPPSARIRSGAPLFVGDYEDRAGGPVQDAFGNAADQPFMALLLAEPAAAHHDEIVLPRCGLLKDRVGSRADAQATGRATASSGYGGGTGLLERRPGAPINPFADSGPDVLREIVILNVPVLDGNQGMHHSVMCLRHSTRGPGSHQRRLGAIRRQEDFCEHLLPPMRRERKLDGRKRVWIGIQYIFAYRSNR